MGVMLEAHNEKIIIDSIVEAEKNTSGEIRVHIEKKCSGNPVERAQQLFEKLGMIATESRNGVLIYIAEESHKFAIIGDVGIHQKVGIDFWNRSKDIMQQHFIKGEFVEGIKEAVLACGDALKKHFPIKHDDSNELPNDISYQ
jgi:uncharacterized membrane protein